MPTQTNPIQKVLFLLLESGLVYLVVQLLALIAEVAGISNPTLIVFEFVTTSMFSTVSVSWVFFDGYSAPDHNFQCLYPVAVIILINMEKSEIDETYYCQHPNAGVRVEVVEVDQQLDNSNTASS
jgi:hypothetical protein